MNRKTVLIALLHSIFCLSSLSSIDIQIDTCIPTPDPSPYYEELKDKLEIRFMGGSRPWVFWLSSHDLYVYYFHLHWCYNLRTRKYSRITEWEELTGYEHFADPDEFGRNDFIELSFVFEGGLKRAIVSLGKEPIILDPKAVFPGFFREITIIKDSPGMQRWEKPLLGGFWLTNRPEIKDVDERFTYGDQTLLTLLDTEKHELYRIPKELFSARIDGNPPSVAVSFDRFKIAVYLIAEQATPDSPLGGWGNIYILNVRYSGTVMKETKIYAQPSFDSESLGTIVPGKNVIVDSADNYMSYQGVEDYWYHIQDENLEGWVYGGELFIEGQDWKTRLEERGPLVPWENIEEYINTEKSRYDKLKASSGNQGSDASSQAPAQAANTSNQMLNDEDEKKNAFSRYIGVASVISGILVFITLVVLIYIRKRKRH
ncbi:SH3 domain-containing protein [Gracilinema caldarium]|uniref:Uncharacterized protein n=1 Tax=Gracilinema caldarium (strain ATCC 51460 / DSM 7334 / H1) TaxID=744872 RepID=F8EYY7_GRAC1|nr:SH3 domain-containing protein [Gracilinema caldarium]AEJ19218.1 hypothetical protein Spica_1070 [Gracilinema caldarium DSM 7334]